MSALDVDRDQHPRLPGLLLGSGEEVADRAERWPVLARLTPYASSFIDVHEERVLGPDGAELARTWVEHPGAVAVVALDDDDRVLLLTQYRHAVGKRLFEVPAGLLDVPREPAAQAAARELAEEADLVAGEWDELATLHSSPGFSDERVTLYAARDLSAVADDQRTTRMDEEADMTALWVPLEVAVDAVFAGRIGNQLTATGLLAAQVLMQRRR